MFHIVDCDEFAAVCTGTGPAGAGAAFGATADAAIRA